SYRNLVRHLRFHSGVCLQFMKSVVCIAEEQAKKLRKQREKDYAAYKAAQGKKPCKPFEKWVLTYQ
ncbi:MAG: hypothetical protein ACKO86_26820, partial [Dolichospermum sp.]